jgi:hypothetical protein
MRPAPLALVLTGAWLTAALGPAARSMAAAGDGAWVLTEAAKNGTATVVSAHRSLADCLEAQRAREAAQREYLRAANESSPRDGLPLPAATPSLRCRPGP